MAIENVKLRSAQSITKKITREGRSLRGTLRPRLWFWSRVARLLPEFALSSMRAHLYRLAGCDIQDGVAILGTLRLVGAGDIAARLHIGSGSIIAPGVTFGLDGEITIGHNVSLSPNVVVYTATHGLGFGSQRMSLAAAAKPVLIGDGVWVGMQSLILPGMTLGQGCVISAGSVIAQDVEPNTLVAGNPASMQQKLPFGNR